MKSHMPDYYRRDLVLDTVAHKDVGRVPHMILCQPAAARRLRERYGVSDLYEVLRNSIEWIADPSADYLADPDMLQNGEYTDLWGIRWHGVGETRGQVSAPRLREPTLKDYRFPRRFSPGSIEKMQAQATRSRGRYRVAKLGALWEQATFLRGMEDLLVDLILHPTFVHELLDGIAEVLLNNLAAYGAVLDVECIWLSDDYGAQAGLIMSPRHWREFIRPRVQQICDAVHAAGYHFVLHSDGAISDVIPDIVNMGADILHPVQPECIDVARAKREFGRDITLWGGYGTQGTLVFGTPAQVRQEVNDLCDLMGAGGGFILSPGISFQAETPVENMVAFVDIAIERERG